MSPKIGDIHSKEQHFFYIINKIAESNKGVITKQDLEKIVQETMQGISPAEVETVINKCNYYLILEKRKDESYNLIDINGFLKENSDKLEDNDFKEFVDDIVCAYFNPKCKTNYKPPASERIPELR
ncbi:MAG: hypothetical protein JW791_03270 [Nanoarchaeota archaeon]|nr:hypothetical protein [Nanoarchaeota archaeon]